MKEKKIDILIIFQVIFAFSVVVIGVYSKFSGNYILIPLIFIFMSGMLFITGLREYNRTGNLVWRILSLFSFLFFLSIVIDAILIKY